MIHNDRQSSPNKEKESTSLFLSNIYKSFPEGLAAMAALDRKDLFLTLGRLVQHARGGNWIKALADEWDLLVKKVKIKEGYEGTDQHYSCLQELLAAIENDLLDEEKFNLLKKIMIVTATEEVYDRENVKPLQFMRIARSLDSGHILVLFATYKIMQKKELWDGDQRILANWLGKVAKESGLGYKDLVMQFEESLIKKGLLTPRIGDGLYEIQDSKLYRLTGLGHALCKYVDHYEIILRQK